MYHRDEETVLCLKEGGRVFHALTIEDDDINLLIAISRD